MDPVPTNRYRVNPVEVAVLAIVDVVFLNSVYRLFYDWEGYRTARPTETAEGESIDEQVPAAPPAAESTGRSPAAIAPPSFVNVEIRCGQTGVKNTTATKVRLAGPICGGIQTDQQELVRTEIVNHANRTSATVFTDVSAGKFSTDYIPLETGENAIYMKFVYQGGKTVSQYVNITRQQ